MKNINIIISKAKKALADSDYKIIKCMEAKLQNKEEMPYDIDEVIEERESYREVIRAYESQVPNRMSLADTMSYVMDIIRKHKESIE